MKRIRLIVALGVFVCFRAEAVVRGKVITVLDGRTAVVHVDGTPKTVRLAGIDTPDAISAEFLRHLIQDRIVSIDFLSAEAAHVYRATDAVFINQEMVCGGYARALVPQFQGCESLAKAAQRGIWSGKAIAGDWESRFAGVRYLGPAAPGPATQQASAAETQNKEKKPKPPKPPKPPKSRRKP